MANNKKGIKIIIILIIILIVSAVVGYKEYHNKQLSILKEEIGKATEIQIMNDDESINKDAKIDMEIKTSGNYAVVEQTLKEYLNNAVELVKEAETIIDTDSIDNIFSEENLKVDSPEFTQSKAKIEELKQKSTEYLDKLADLCNEEKLLSAINDKNVSDYYKEIYKKLAIDNKASEELKNSMEGIESAKIKVTTAFDWVTKVLNFLSDNKNYWVVQDGKIAFTDQGKLNEYSKLIQEAPEM